MGIASDTYAKIIREQYDDWKNRFYPKQQELMNQATSGELMNAQLGRVGENTETAINNAKVGQDNMMGRMGVQSTQDANDNSMGLKTSLAVAGAKNGIRSAENERQNSILSGASMGLRNAINTKIG